MDEHYLIPDALIYNYMALGRFQNVSKLPRPQKGKATSTLGCFQRLKRDESFARDWGSLQHQQVLREHRRTGTFISGTSELSGLLR